MLKQDPSYALPIKPLASQSDCSNNHDCQCGRKNQRTFYDSVSVIDTESIARDTIRLTLERPVGFEYRAGSNIDLGVAGCPDDPFDAKRALSLASAPCEPELEVALRFRDTPFKNAVRELKAGDTVSIDGPYGTMRFDQEPTQPAVFIAGGIGITPILSMVTQLASDRWPGEVYLFYSNRTPVDAAYPGRLADLADRMTDFKLIPVFTRSEATPDFPGAEHSRIDAAMVSKHVDKARQAKYYVVGTSEMVWSMLAQLDRIADRKQIVLEDFTGF